MFLTDWSMASTASWLGCLYKTIIFPVLPGCASGLDFANGKAVWITMLVCQSDWGLSAIVFGVAIKFYIQIHPLGGQERLIGDPSTMSRPHLNKVFTCSCSRCLWDNSPHIISKSWPWAATSLVPVHLGAFFVFLSASFPVISLLALANKDIEILPWCWPQLLYNYSFFTFIAAVITQMGFAPATSLQSLQKSQWQQQSEMCREGTISKNKLITYRLMTKSDAYKVTIAINNSIFYTKLTGWGVVGCVH